jgi:hypothetical protein
MSDQRSDLSLFDGWQQSGLTPAQLWVRYYSVRIIRSATATRLSGRAAAPGQPSWSGRRPPAAGRGPRAAGLGGWGRV